MTESQAVATEPSGRPRVALAACVGNAVEWYDFAVFGALAGTLGFVFFPTEDPTTSLLAAFALYGTAFFFRPLGAVLLGGLGDRWGRRRVLLMAVTLMTVSTAAVGLLPPYAAAGVIAALLVVALRAVQGFSAGGEAGVLGAYLIESAGPGARARQASWMLATSALGIALGMLVAGGLTGWVGLEGMRSGWWRLPFLLALPLGVAGLFMRRTLLETLVTQEAPVALPQSRPPQSRSFTERTVRGFTLIAAGSLAYNVFFIFSPAYLVAHGQRPGLVLMITATMLVCSAALALLAGRFSDRHGRRPVALGCATLLLVSSPFLLPLAHGSLLGLLSAQAVVGLAAVGLLNPTAPAELFSMPERARGLGLTVGLASALVGGSGPLVATVLISLSGSLVVIGCYVSLVSLLALAALRSWPETAFTKFSEIDHVGVDRSSFLTHGG